MLRAKFVLRNIAITNNKWRNEKRVKKKEKSSATARAITSNNKKRERKLNLQPFYVPIFVAITHWHISAARKRIYLLERQWQPWHTYYIGSCAVCAMCCVHIVLARREKEKSSIIFRLGLCECVRLEREMMQFSFHH